MFSTNDFNYKNSRTAIGAKKPFLGEFNLFILQIGAVRVNRIL